MPEPEPSTRRRRRRRILIPIPLMEKTISKIFRRSIYTFLQNYHHFTTTVALLALPFSVAVLLSQSLFVSSSSSSLLLPSIYSHLRTLFHGFPSSSSFEFFTWKLSQTISSFIITLPFTLTFFLIAKASVIQTLQHKLKQQKNNNIGFRDSYSSSASNIFCIFKPLLITYLCNSFLILSANATIFGLLFFTFNFLFHEGSPNFLLFLFTAVGAVLYSLVLANALIICNLGLVLSGIERSSEYLPIIRRAFVLIRSGRTSIALSLALPIHLVLAAIEGLFQYRVMLKAYHHHLNPASVPNSCSLFFEGIFIAYLYSICGVLDTVISFIFYESCKINGSPIQQQQSKQLEPTSNCFEIQMAEDEGHYYVSIKILNSFPSLSS